MTTNPNTETPELIEIKQPQFESLYHLVLLDDDQHTYDYVIEMLASIFGYESGKAWALARVVDIQGQAILQTASNERCQANQKRIHSYGADSRIPTSRGSMSAIIEKASTPSDAW